MKDEREFLIEFADNDWDLSQPGYRPIDQVVYVDGVEVDRERCPEPGYYEPDSEPGDATSRETQAEMDEVAFRRAATLGQGVVVAGFPSSGAAHVYDLDIGEDR